MEKAREEEKRSLAALTGAMRCFIEWKILFQLPRTEY